MYYINFFSVGVTTLLYQLRSTQVRVKNYSASRFTRVTGSGEITITYTTTDSRNNTTEEQVKVGIVDTDDTKEGQIDFDGRKHYARFISPKYYQKSYEEGGLEDTSKWRNEESYQRILSDAMNHIQNEDGGWQHVVQTWEFSKEEINQVKEYVSEQGLGGSIND